MEKTGINETTIGDRFATACEVGVVLASGLAMVACGIAAFGSHPAVTIGAVWLANLLMIGLIYRGLVRRGQSWSHFGLTLSIGGFRSCLRVFLYSIHVLFLTSLSCFILLSLLL